MRNVSVRQRTRRGFTLTEIAIVLGVAGVIIGAVWGAASSVREKANVARAGEELGLIATSIQTMYASRDVTFGKMNAAHALNATPSADFGYYMTIYTTPSGNIFPTEMLSGPNPVNNPWGGTVQAALVGTVNNPVQFAIEYQDVPADACAALISNNSTPGRETGLMQIIVSNSSSTLGTYTGAGLPVSLGTLGGVCTAANAPFTIDWYYKLGQGCAPGAPC